MPDTLVGLRNLERHKDESDTVPPSESLWTYREDIDTNNSNSRQNVIEVLRQVKQNVVEY